MLLVSITTAGEAVSISNHGLSFVSVLPLSDSALRAFEAHVADLCVHCHVSVLEQCIRQAPGIQSVDGLKL